MTRMLKMNKITMFLLTIVICILCLSTSTNKNTHQTQLESVQDTQTIEVIPTHPYDNVVPQNALNCAIYISKLYNVKLELILAIIHEESNFQHDIIYNNCYGLMQIHKINHEWLQNDLGKLNFLNEHDNILAGTYMIYKIQQKYSDIDQILMVYNYGETGAKRAWKKGIKTTKYNINIKNYINELKKIK